MSDIFYIKRGDTSPRLVYKLFPDVNLTGASAVFNMRKKGAANTVNRGAATVVAPATGGTLSYPWAPADTATEGQFEAEFEVTYADLTVETYPNNGFITVQIKEDLG